MLKIIAETNVAEYSSHKLRILRATMNGASAGDQDLFDDAIDEIVEKLNITEEQAEKRLAAYITQKLEQDDKATQQSWQQRVNDESATGIHADGDPCDFT